MRIGILGSGLMGGKLGTIFARAGHAVVFSYARSNEKLNKLARDARGKARAGAPVEAAKEADALLLAVHWSRIDDVLEQAGDLSGKVIVTAPCRWMPAIRNSSSPTPRRERKSLPRKFRGPRWFVLSIPCPARCCSGFLQPDARAPGRAWSIAVTTSNPKTRPQP